MAPPHHNKKKPSSLWSAVKANPLDAAWQLVVNPERAVFAAVALLLLEVAVNAFVVMRVPYTEIDWVAYMEEVAGVLVNGTYDYAELRGGTGPLVYPAGFVWFYSGLYYITDSGKDIRQGQVIFVAFYLVTLALVFRLMVKSKKVPPYALAFMSLASYRVHSIFVLRLFNDPVAMMFAYAALNCFVSDWWILGSVLYSLAVSIKMNVLLFAPALFFAYLAVKGFAGTVVNLSICALIQLILAIPFLLENPVNYVLRAFDLGRVFLFEWTVNFRFLPEEIFVDRTFHISLLVAHVVVLLLSIPKWWKMLTSYSTLRRNQGPTDSVQLLLLPLFMSNFIGVAFARSLHYQFYVWYFHQLHYLLWCTRLPVVVKILVLGVIELCWNTYPSTVWSSALLHGCHFVLLTSLLASIYGIVRSSDDVAGRLESKRK